VWATFVPTLANSTKVFTLNYGVPMVEKAQLKGLFDDANPMVHQANWA
jgi:hypothetical protein